MLQRFNETRWRSLTAFPLKTVDNVCSNGSSVGLTAFSHRGSTLKGTKLKFQTCTKISNKFFVTILEMFGPPFYMVIILPDYRLPLPFSSFYSINIPHSAADQPATCHTVVVGSDK